MAEVYRSIDPSDTVLAVNQFAAEPYRSIDPSDVVSAIREVDPNVRSVDRSDFVPVANELAGGGEPPIDPEEPPPPEPVAVASLWNTNPALVLVDSADIGKFADGDVVTMAGVQPPYDFVNGSQTIANVGVGGDQFELVGVDLTAAGTTISGAGVTVTPATPPATYSSQRRRRN